MNEVSLEILVTIAQHVELADLCHWMLTAKKYKFALEEELYAKALSLDLQRGWPCHLVRVTLQNQTTNAFKALLQGTSVKDINKGIDDLRPQLGGVRTPIAVLPQYRNHNVGVASWSHADEPRIRDSLVAAAAASQCIMAHHLSCAGLACEVDALKMRGRRRTCGRGRSHRIRDDLPVLRCQRNCRIARARECLMNCG